MGNCNVNYLNARASIFSRHEAWVPPKEGVLTPRTHSQPPLPWIRPFNHLNLFTQDVSLACLHTTDFKN